LRSRQREKGEEGGRERRVRERGERGEEGGREREEGPERGAEWGK
jgi:hypothetical protein